MAFKISKKNTSDIWIHSNTNNSSEDLILSVGYFRIVNDEFELYSESGGQIRSANISDIIVQDNSTGGGEEFFATSLELATRLKALAYPYFPDGISGNSGVDSVFGRTGVVVADAGDYLASQITNDSNVTGTNVDDALNYLDSINSSVWADFSGAWASGTGILTLGDYNEENNGTRIYVDDGNNNIKLYGTTYFVGSSGFQAIVDTNNLSLDRNYDFPDASGTLALTSDITTVTLQTVIDNGNIYVNGFNTWTWSAGTFSNRDTDEDWGFNLSGEVFQFTDSSGGSAGKTQFSSTLISIGNGTYRGDIASTNLTATRNFELPDTSGTLALTSDIAVNSYWANYTSTTNLKLGDWQGSNNGTYLIIDDQNEEFEFFNASVTLNNYLQVNGDNGILLNNSGDTFYTWLRADSGLSANRTIRFPDATGTVALTSDISASYFEQVSTDAYTGDRLNITDSNLNGFYVERDVNEKIGAEYVNTDATGSGALAEVSVSSASTLYDNGISISAFGDSYYITEFQSQVGILATSDMFIMAVNNDFTWWYGSANNSKAIAFQIPTATGNLVLSRDLEFSDGTYEATVQNGTLSGDITLTLPNTTGTIALTSDITTVNADQEVADFNAVTAQVGLMVDVDSATDVVVTVRDFATEAIPVGSVLTYRQSGAGKISNAYSVATGDTSTTYREGDVLTLWHKSQDNWVVINPPHAIDSQTAGEPTGSDQVLNVVSLTQAEYDAAVGSHNADTLYVITS